MVIECPLEATTKSDMRDHFIFISQTGGEKLRRREYMDRYDGTSTKGNGRMVNEGEKRELILSLSLSLSDNAHLDEEREDEESEESTDCR